MTSLVEMLERLKSEVRSKVSITIGRRAAKLSFALIRERIRLITSVFRQISPEIDTCMSHPLNRRPKTLYGLRPTQGVAMQRDCTGFAKGTRWGAGSGVQVAEAAERQLSRRVPQPGQERRVRASKTRLR